jgi:hypothetical protein
MLQYKPSGSKKQTDLKSYRQAFWKNVKTIKQGRPEMSIAQFFKLIKAVNNTQWEALLRGDSDFTFDQVIDVAIGLQCKISDLFGGL